MRTANARLRRLEALAPAGCATCRFWGPCVYEIGDRGTDRGDRCPDCGRYVEIKLLRRIIIVPPGDV